MKKTATLIACLTTSLWGSFQATAGGLSPATGEAVQTLPWVIGVVALVLVVASVLLSWFLKKTGKK